jgi:hypothetical protein
MPSLPHNIWVHVAQYLPALFLRDLITVNRSFFEIAMDCRYRQLILAYMDSRMVKNLVRLRSVNMILFFHRGPRSEVIAEILPSPNGFKSSISTRDFFPNPTPRPCCSTRQNQNAWSANDHSVPSSPISPTLSSNNEPLPPAIPSTA